MITLVAQSFDCNKAHIHVHHLIKKAHHHVHHFIKKAHHHDYHLIKKAYHNSQLSILNYQLNCYFPASPSATLP
jgi:hypothetical protein